MISFVVKGGLEKADRVLCNTQIFALRKVWVALKA